MNIGLDIGYSAVKVVSGDRRATFASVTGTPDRARFSLNGSGPDLTLVEPVHVAIGDNAVVQSRFLNRREDRHWIDSDDYHHLFLAALTEATRATSVDITLVTGLPVAYYTDRDQLQNRLDGIHRAQRAKRHAQQFRVQNLRIIPQPFGSLLSIALDNRGRVTDQDLAAGTIGVIDIGGKTTNILSVYRLAEVGRETASVSIGAWDITRSVRQYLAEHCPDLDLRDHQIQHAIRDRAITYYGEQLDISPVVAAATNHLADQVIAEASQLWNGAAGLNAILLTGGGAHLAGPRLKLYWPHARLCPDPVYANASGYWKLAQRFAGTTGQ